MIEDSNNALKNDPSISEAYFSRGIAKANLTKINNKIDACKDFDLARKGAGEQADRMVKMANKKYCE